MLELLWDVFLDGLLDALKALPFLFGAYLLMEFLEHRAGDKLTDTLSRLGPWGPVGGAVLGCVPQCGFSVAAANFYAGRLITPGTLIAVFLATSDEAVPILLSQPGALPDLGKPGRCSAWRRTCGSSASSPPGRRSPLRTCAGTAAARSTGCSAQL